MAKVLFIVSGGSRRGLLTLASLPAARPGHDVVIVEAPGEAERAAREAARLYDVVAAVGGDGTVAEVATGLLACGAPACLGIVPAGTGNDFAHSAGIHSRAEGLAAIEAGCERAVDAVEVTYRAGGGEATRLSLVGTGIGFPSAVALRATRRVKRVLGRWAYQYGVVTEALSYRPHRMCVTIDGEAHEGAYILAAVVNTERTGRQTMRIAPGARIDDGVLDVLLVDAASPWRLLLQSRRLRDGSHVELPEVLHIQGREVTVDGDAPLMVDGDAVGHAPARFRILPGALRLVVGG